VSLILGGKEYAFPQSETYRDNPRWLLKIPEDGYKKKQVPDKIILHTTRGKRPVKVRPGRGPKGDDAERNIRYWAGNGKAAATGS
jgi:hypothetical protein